MTQNFMGGSEHILWFIFYFVLARIKKKSLNYKLEVFLKTIYSFFKLEFQG